MPITPGQTEPSVETQPVKYKSRDDSGRVPIFPFVPFPFSVVDQLKNQPAFSHGNPLRGWPAAGGREVTFRERVRNARVRPTSPLNPT